MITTLDITDILYAKLAASDLVGTTSSITGSIYKLTRPMDSVKEDVVINCLPVTGTNPLQLATANVNIYVPDLHATVNGIRQYLPDFARMDTLAAKAIAAVDNTNAAGYFYWVASQSIFDEDTTHQHFINLRIDFKNINPLNH